MLAPAPRYAPRPALVVLLLASTLGVMAGAIVMPVLELVRDDLDLGGTAAGLIITAHGLVIALSGPLVGRLLDRYGLRVPLAVGLILYGLGGGAGSVTTSYPALMASRVVLGVGAALVFSGTTVALLALFDGPERDRVMGWRGTATSAGGLIWPLLGGLVGGFSWHATFAIYLVGVPLGVAAMRWIPDERPGRTGAVVPTDGAFGFVRRHPALVAWYGLMLLTGLLLYSLAAFLPRRMAELGVTEPLRISLFLTAMAFAAGVVGMIYGRVRARWDEHGILRLTALTWVGAFSIIGLVDRPGALLVAAALFGLGQGVMFPAITVLIGDAPPIAHRGQATALSATAMFVGQFLSPLVFGPLMAATSITTGYLVAGAASAAIPLVVRAGARAASSPRAVSLPGAGDGSARRGAR